MTAAAPAAGALEGAGAEGEDEGHPRYGHLPLPTGWLVGDAVSVAADRAASSRATPYVDAQFRAFELGWAFNAGTAEVEWQCPRWSVEPMLWPEMRDRGWCQCLFDYCLPVACDRWASARDLRDSEERVRALVAEQHGRMSNAERVAELRARLGLPPRAERP